MNSGRGRQMALGAELARASFIARLQLKIPNDEIARPSICRIRMCPSFRRFVARNRARSEAAGNRFDRLRTWCMEGGAVPDWAGGGIGIFRETWRDHHGEAAQETTGMGAVRYGLWDQFFSIQ